MDNKTQDSSWSSTVSALTKDVCDLSSRPSGWDRPLVSLLAKLVREHGAAHALKMLKTYFTWMQLRMLKQTQPSLPYHAKFRDGIPKVLKPWRSLIKGSAVDQRFCLSLWRTLEVLRLKPTLDLSPIIDEQTEEDENLFREFTNWLPTWTGLRNLPKDLEPNRLVVTNKAGPNGPSAEKSLCDLAALKTDKKLYSAVDKLLRLKMPYEISLNTFKETEGPYEYHSRIAALSDKFGKTRVIAIGDLFSQSALSTVHDSFMKGLRTMVSDCTYCQSDIPTMIQKLGIQLYSSDLSQATDRFPLKWQEAIVKQRYGQEVSELWKTVLTERTFRTDQGPVRYATGTPMGLLSSWPVFAFTHHAFMEWCAWRCGIRSYKSYIVLGDDIICNNKEVSDLYQASIKQLGVSVSATKCTSSENGYAEFAKRLFTPEGEVTGIPVTILQKVRSQPEQAIELVQILRGRGYLETEITVGIEKLLSNWTSHKDNIQKIVLALSAPVCADDAPRPLKFSEEWLSKYAPNVSWSQDELPIEEAFALAEDHIFWSEISALAERQRGRNITEAELPEWERFFDLHGPCALEGFKTHQVDNSEPSRYCKEKQLELPVIHPINVYICKHIMPKMLWLNKEEQHTNDAVYKQWLSGNLRDKIYVPKSEDYRCKTRGHKKTRCRFEIVQIASKLTQGKLKALELAQPKRVLREELAHWNGVLNRIHYQISFVLRDFDIETD